MATNMLGGVQVPIQVMEADQQANEGADVIIDQSELAGTAELTSNSCRKRESQVLMSVSKHISPKT